MDNLIAISILISVAALTLLFVYVISRTTIRIGRATIKREVEQIQQEPSSICDSHIVFIDFPESKYVYGLLGISIFVSGMIIIDYVNQAMNSIDMPDLSGYIIALVAFNVVLIGAFNLAQLLYYSPAIMVTKDGLEKKKFGPLGNRASIMLPWDRITGTSCGVSRTDQDRVRIVIKGDGVKIAVWPYYVNFEYLADAMVRYGPKSGENKAFSVFERKANELSNSTSRKVSEWNFLNPKQTSNKAYAAFLGMMVLGLVFLTGLMVVADTTGPHVVLENLSVKEAPINPSDAGYKYVIISGTIDNQYSDYHLVNPNEFELKTASGGDYHYSSAVSYKLPSQVDAKSKVTFQIGFEIPINDTPSIFKYQWGGFQYSEARCPAIS